LERAVFGPPFFFRPRVVRRWGELRLDPLQQNAIGLPMDSASRDTLAFIALLILLGGYIFVPVRAYLKERRQPIGAAVANKITRQRYGGNGTNIGTVTASLIDAPYRAYTTNFDVEISSEQLCAEVRDFAPVWSPVLDEWRDAAQSIRIPAEFNVGRIPKAALLVTLLVDHSGSVRGDKARRMAAAVDSGALRFEDLNIKSEIIGFTTRSWHGGNSRKIWLADGKPQNPGRLCDLMYVLYKSWDQPYAARRAHLGVMTVDDIQRENLDGEAVRYAHARYRASGRKRWVCVVLSDGAPVDDSTLMSNKNTILDEHIRATVALLSADSDVTVAGLGIGCSVGGYYPVSDSAADPGDTAPKLSALIELALRQRPKSPIKKMSPRGAPSNTKIAIARDSHR
jgi:cobalamin biosynthesis protein CobT